MAKRSGTGQGGKSIQDREIAAKVRTKGLNCLNAILSGNKEVEKWSEYKKNIVSRMAASLLPRLNEHSGEGGEPIKLAITGMKIIQE